VSSGDDLDLLRALEASGAFRQGHYRLSSGRHSADYVQCALLLQVASRARQVGESLARLFEDVDISSVVAPALGGVLIGHEVASALGLPFRFTERKDQVMTLRRGFSFQPGETVLLIEDVVTTGRSTLETMSVVEAAGARVVAVGSIIDRTGEDFGFDLPFHSLLRLALQTFAPEDCPLCSDQRPLESPGSRLS
jgi:orotate phosphoribosyltransferase